MAENAQTERNILRAMDRVSQACDNQEFTISTKRTEVLDQPAPRMSCSKPSLEWKILQMADKFTFLGITISSVVHINGKVIAIPAKGSVVCYRLCKNVRERNGTRLETKLEVCTAVVRSILSYESCLIAFRFSSPREFIVLAPLASVLSSVDEGINHFQRSASPSLFGQSKSNFWEAGTKVF